MNRQKKFCCERAREWALVHMPIFELYLDKNKRRLISRYISHRRSRRNTPTTSPEPYSSKTTPTTETLRTKLLTCSDKQGQSLRKERKLSFPRSRRGEVYSARWATNQINTGAQLNPSCDDFERNELCQTFTLWWICVTHSLSCLPRRVPCLM